jgi:hypothetical protein
LHYLPHDGSRLERKSGVYQMKNFRSAVLVMALRLSSKHV